MKNRTTRFVTAAVLLSLTLAAHQASATLIAHEPFEYDRTQWSVTTTDTGTGIAGLSGGTGWNGAWNSTGTYKAGIPVWPDDYPANNRTAPLAYTDSMGNPLLTSGNQMRTAFVNNSWDRRLLAEPIGALGSTVWVSFMAQSDSITTGNPRYAFVELANTDFNNRLWIGKVTPIVTGNWGINLPDNTGAGVLSADFGGAVKMNEQTMFLMKLEFPETSEGLTSLSVWLNPPDLTNESALSSTVFSGTMKYSMWNQVGVAGRYSTDFDEIRIGTTFASVTPIPEPGTAGLLGLGLGLVLLVRRALRQRSA
jgi:hypothetical protein